MTAPRRLALAAWIARVTGGEERSRRRADEARAAAERRGEDEREARLAALSAALAREPFATWTRAGALPDYAGRYRRLAATRDEAVRLAHEREEVELAMELGIRRHLDRLRDAYLACALARVAFLELLLALAEERPAPASEPEAPPAVPLTRAASALDRLPFPFSAPPAEKVALPDARELLTALAARVAELRGRAEPASAEARAWHAEILEKKGEVVAGWAARDRAVAAQLDALPDAFGLVLARVRAVRFDAGEVSATMESLLDRMAETERLVTALGPAMASMVERGAG